MKSDLRSESIQRKFSRILSVYDLTTGCFKKNRENYPKKAFAQRNKETRTKALPWVSANQPSNNWAQITRLVS